MESAARTANAHEFIENLPQGYDTMMIERGSNLSQGQRQMITIARAMVADPKIMILDEATSMYDLASEAAFVEECVEVMKDRTVILITHRPASLSLADRVIKLGSDGVVSPVKREGQPIG